MKILSFFSLLSLLFCGAACLFLTRCTPIVLVGGGVTAGSLALREKPTGEILNDSMISTRVIKAIYKVDPQLQAQVGVNVQEKEVLLTGAVPSEEQKCAVEEAVWKVKHVKRVYNHIDISDNPPIHNYAKDAWITSQIKTKLLSNFKVRSVNYSVKTVNNVVFIFGIARTQEELEKVVKTASRTHGVERVMSYIRLKSGPEEPVE